MLNVLLIEDEEPAARRLKKLILELLPDAVLPDSIVSVASGIAWLGQHSMPDLIFSDIQLSDGLSFEIFKGYDVTCPVIFTTAYDQYAIEAFKVNSIDYLLKPVKKEELESAIRKFKKLSASHSQPLNIDKLLQTLQPALKPEHKRRFVVRYGDHIKTIGIEDVVYFYTEDKISFLCTKDARRYVIDFNLDMLTNMLDPKIFFRINRQYIIGIHAIADMYSYSKSRVLVKLSPPAKHETIVSAERSAEFKHWLGDEK